MTTKLASWQFSVKNNTRFCTNSHTNINMFDTFSGAIIGIKEWLNCEKSHIVEAPVYKHIEAEWSIYELRDDVIKWKRFPRYWPFVRETTGHRWIPITKASDAELWCFLWSVPEQTVEERIVTPVILDAISLIMTSLWWVSGPPLVCLFGAESFIWILNQRWFIVNWTNFIGIGI